MLFKALIFSSLVCFAVASLELIPCGDKNAPIPISLEVEGCSQFPCPMYRGETAKCNVTFQVPADTDSIKTSVKAKVGWITTNYPIPDNEVCHFLSNGKQCPLKAGDVVSYTLAVEIKKIFPSVKFTMSATLTDQNTKKPITCFTVQGKVQSRPKRRAYYN